LNSDEKIRTMRLNSTNLLKISFFVFLFLAPAFVFAQNTDAQLAAQYYRNGEYEKASMLYKNLYDQSRFNYYYFDKYVNCLLNLERYDECEQTIKKEFKRNSDQLQLLVAYGNLLERQFKDEEAKKKFEEAIVRVPGNRNDIVRLANAFVGLTKYEYAIQTYEKGMKVMRDPKLFAYNLGDLYRRKGDTPKMIENYLRSIQQSENYVNTLKNQFGRNLDEEGFTELQRQLFGFIQTAEDDIPYIELLSWVFIQKEDYSSALRQLKALDRRLNENGARVYRMAETAANAGAYDAAIGAYEYIIEEKGNTSTYYIDAKREALSCRRKKVVEDYEYTREDLLQLEQKYLAFLNEFGRNRTTATIIAELADLYAFYLNDLEEAIKVLSDLIEYPGVDRIVKAKAKISLADFYLMQGERWESTLLYSQVDKEFKDDMLGHEARFRNAKLSYYMGDFQWAQAQFDVLKASTSKLISNDALDLSIFIMDNLGLDTTEVSLRLYAKADLLTFQNRFEAAFDTLDYLQQQFPEHSLQDDVFYAKAKLYKKIREYDKAIEMYQLIIDKHKEEIRADNALYELAQLYDYQLGEPEKAKDLYETLFIDFSNSVYAVDARKRYRILRGDDIQ
jgi:tetratricopeptide (TPR) repeat protein